VRVPEGVVLEEQTGSAFTSHTLISDLLDAPPLVLVDQAGNPHVFFRTRAEDASKYELRHAFRGNCQ